MVTANREVLADRVHEMILAHLLDENLPPGAPISIDGMARQLDVSPTPVREALARLEATGLVRREALRGYRVAPLLSADELGQLMDARRILETAHAAFACESADATTIAELCVELEHATDEMHASPRGPSFSDFRSYYEADERFHRLIAEHAGNRFLLSAHQALGGQLQRFRYFVGLGVTDADAAVAEHRAIAKAIAKRDPELAAKRVETHLVNAKKRAIASLATAMAAQASAASTGNGASRSR